MPSLIRAHRQSLDTQGRNTRPPHTEVILGIERPQARLHPLGLDPLLCQVVQKLRQEGGPHIVQNEDLVENFGL